MTNFASLVEVFLDIINLAIPVIFAITLLVVIWKVFQAWIVNGGDPSSIEAGKKTVLVAVIVFIFMTGIWGIVQLLRDSLFQ